MPEEITVSNDPTKKFLGFPYQQLIAIEETFNAKTDDTIWLECKGDVASKDTMTEVKHHFNDVNLSDNSVDFWRTLKNIVDERHLVAQYNFCVLHTTANILEKSIFYDWNNCSCEDKYTKLENITPPKTIKSYYEEIFNLDKEELLSILDKFSIKSSQPKIEEKWEELKEHTFLSLISDNFKEQALYAIHGYVTKKAIENNELWHINKKDFDKDMRHALRGYLEEKMIFPKFFKKDISSHSSKCDFHFVNELKLIRFPSKLIDISVSDYLRANLSQHKMIEDSPIIVESLERYDDDIFENIDMKKSLNSVNISKDDIGKNKSLELSQKIFTECIEEGHHEIDNVEQTQKYYRNGRIHDLVENKKFCWRYEENDFDS